MSAGKASQNTAKKRSPPEADEHVEEAFNAIFAKRNRFSPAG
jgi:hypothetical protein